MGNVFEQGLRPIVRAKCPQDKFVTSPVGPLPQDTKSGMHPLFADGSDHDGLADPRAFEHTDPTSELHNTCGFKVIALPGQRFIELVAQSDARNWVPGAADALGDE